MSVVMQSNGGLALASVGGLTGAYGMQTIGRIGRTTNEPMSTS